MTSYIPNTYEQQMEMLNKIGYESFEDLVKHIPSDIKLNRELKIPPGKTEYTTANIIADMAKKNIRFQNIYRGAGAYNHYIPSVVRHLSAREEFVSAYTPYQAEISQGILQAIFEYQTMICELTGLDAANASVYDGATAAAESISMSRGKNKTNAVVSATVKPHVLKVIATYLKAYGLELIIVPCKNGTTDLEELQKSVNEHTACVYVEQLSFYGLIEDIAQIEKITHAKKAKLILGVNPIALGLLKSPSELNADIACGEGQPLGMPLSFGGPYLGFMSCKKELMRSLPGRIVGQTQDVDGKRAFVLTMQAREQHIKREKASSGICSNQALCALTAGLYLSAMGKSGLAETAHSCYANAHYLAEQITKIDGFDLAFTGEFFHEFSVKSSIDSEIILNKLEANGILGGLPTEYGIIWCATELNSKEQMDKLVSILWEVAK